MLKKVLIVGALVVAVGAFLFGRDAVSYVSMGIDGIRNSVKDCIPVEVEIERAKGELAKLEPAMREFTRQKYNEAVSVNKLEQEIAAADQKLSRDRAEIGILKSHVESGEQYVTFGERDYSQQEMVADLTRRFERFKVAQATVETKRQILAERKQVLASMQEKLEAMETAKGQLALEIENLEARLAAVEVAKARSEFMMDDSDLARVRSLVDEISSRIEVDAKMLDHESDAYPEIPVTQPENSGDILNQINQYFDGTDGQVVHLN